MSGSRCLEVCEEFVWKAPTLQCMLQPLEIFVRMSSASRIACCGGYGGHIKQALPRCMTEALRVRPVPGLDIGTCQPIFQGKKLHLN